MIGDGSVKDKILIYLFYFAIIGMACLLPASVVCADIFIIGNKNVANYELSAKEIREIFLGKQKRWSDNKEIKVVLLDKSEVHKEFIEKHIHRSSNQFKNWWFNRVYTGKDRFPEAFDTEEDLMEYVSKTDGAVGYVSSIKSIDSTIKVFKITEK